jgi:hypothetical protein
MTICGDPTNVHAKPSASIELQEAAATINKYRRNAAGVCTWKQEMLLLLLDCEDILLFPSLQVQAQRGGTRKETRHSEV